MGRLLKKEFRLAASPLSYFFIAFSLMAFIPGYPILLSAYFVCLGIFYSYQQGRESDDITYTVLLPVRKRDVVRAKYMFALIIELIAFLLSAAFTMIRLFVLKDSQVYLKNAMMNANVLYLGFILIIFAVFNLLFIGVFFRTAYKIGVPFIVFTIVSFLVLFAGEAIHHIPGLEYVNSPSGVYSLQLIIFAAGAVFFVISFIISLILSEKNFERIDL